MDRIIARFLPILKELVSNGEANVYIGGSVAFRLMGIDTLTMPLDLDIIIYYPRQRQMDILNNPELFTQITEKLKPGYDHIVYKHIVKERMGPEQGADTAYLDHVMDVIVEESLQPPDYYITYTIDGLTLGIHSVERILEAKRRYLRDKDIQQIKYIRDNVFYVVEGIKPDDAPSDPFNF
jgi:hypothetical protein